MWIFILEAALALGLLLLIVWWTLGPVRKREVERELQNAESREHKK